MLKPDDTIQFFTSPYRRTRETTEGILSSLTSETEEEGPSPFPRHTIKVFEEPRLREQDFGNFQPCSTEMERMWQERADYGHFFYRIPNGESAADAYDRVSGFNESLWRNFNEDDFPSVCVLVTHGLMTRVFLMKWYHWSVEYFEDLRNVNHCEFVIMQKNLDSGKYVLQNQMRTWSEYKRRAIPQHNAQDTASQVQEDHAASRNKTNSPPRPKSPTKNKKTTLSPLKKYLCFPHPSELPAQQAQPSQIHPSPSACLPPAHPSSKVATAAALSPAWLPQQKVSPTSQAPKATTSPASNTTTTTTAISPTQTPTTPPVHLQNAPSKVAPQQKI